MQKIITIMTILIVSGCYTNPVQGQKDSPDPGVLFYNGSYYAVTTMGWDGHYFPIWKSSSGTNFTRVQWAMPSPPAWTACCDYWAPELHIINGKFLLYYTARDKNSKLTIGSAIASNILGPYVDRGSPLVKNQSEGVIDATILRDGVRNYIVYKVDGNAHGHPTQFWALLLDPTGMNTTGNPIFLLRNDQTWERGIIQGQWFVKEGSFYYLFYSGCPYNNECYSVGVAKSQNALGPYVKYQNNPILKTRNPQTSKSWLGPGHCSVVKTPSGKWIIFYHAWPHNQIGVKRLMLLDTVQFKNGWPVVNDNFPSQDSMPNPKMLQILS